MNILEQAAKQAVKSLENLESKSRDNKQSSGNGLTIKSVHNSSLILSCININYEHTKNTFLLSHLHLQFIFGRKAFLPFRLFYSPTPGRNFLLEKYKILMLHEENLLLFSISGHFRLGKPFFSLYTISQLYLPLVFRLCRNSLL
jgi:hypothetical protein